MLFNSLTFLVFFLFVLLGYRLPLQWQMKKLFLLIVSYIFYAAWNPPFVLLLWLSTLVDWFVAKKIYQSDQNFKRKLYLVLTLLINLGILVYFKYGNFLLDNFVHLMAAIDINYTPEKWSIVLPIGISFYTFQSLSYSLDIYFKRETPTNKFVDFALFVTFFPQLVAGPIVKSNQLIPQFENSIRIHFHHLFWGAILISLGLFQKIVIADSLLSKTANNVFNNPEYANSMEAWIGALAFSGQIVSDFSGYSTIAIGTAYCLGFSLPRNFNFPYAAIGFSDFWRRWHISLSSWLKEYLYIPLGGNRVYFSRTLLNLMTTMLIGGLWHGANWNFVIWGALHGLYLIIERICKTFFGNIYLFEHAIIKLFFGLITFASVLLAWVFFRSTDFASALFLIRSMFGMGISNTPLLSTQQVITTLLTMSLLLITHAYMRDRCYLTLIAKSPKLIVSALWSIIILILMFSQGSQSEFIYFRF